MGIALTPMARMTKLAAARPRGLLKIFIDQRGDVLTRQSAFRFAAEKAVLELADFSACLVELALELLVTSQGVGMSAFPIARLGAKRRYLPT